MQQLTVDMWEGRVSPGPFCSKAVRLSHDCAAMLPCLDDENLTANHVMAVRYTSPRLIFYATLFDCPALQSTHHAIQNNIQNDNVSDLDAISHFVLPCWCFWCLIESLSFLVRITVLCHFVEIVVSVLAVKSSKCTTLRTPLRTFMHIATHQRSMHLK